jgi:hypothetical protein
MGFSPGMAAALLVFVELVRHDPDVNIVKVASAAGTLPSALYNATARFLDKVGRTSDPKAPLVDRVRAAFPPRD